MKKLSIISFFLLSAAAASAQNNFESFQDRDFNLDFLHGAGVLIGIFLFTSFILSMIKLFLDSRLKSKMIQKGISENVVEQYLRPTAGDARGNAIKWFLILACIGLGLTLVDMTMPVGIHSVAIMAFCTSLGFLGYYFFIRKSSKQ